jgi:deoxyribonuclease-4
MAGLLFGTGGVPISSAERSTISGIERISELGLDCMEVEFVHGVTMGEVTANQVSETAKRLGIVLSVHAPYFINFNAMEVEKRKGSRRRLLQSARIGALCGARNIVFHAAFYLGNEPQKVFDAVRDGLAEMLKAEKSPVCLRPEVTGKNSQFGDIEETLDLCLEVPGLLPCLDVAHWHARTGKFNTYDEIMQVLKRFETSWDGLGWMICISTSPGLLTAKAAK